MERVSLEKHVTDLAKEMNVEVTKVHLTAGKPLGCIDASLLSIVSGHKLVSEFLMEKELDSFRNGDDNSVTLKIKAALNKLQQQLAS